MGKALTGESEFALIKQHLETALHAATSWMGDHDVYASLADVAAMAYDRTALRQYAQLAEELAVRHGHALYQATAHRALGVAHRLANEYAEAEVRLNHALEIFHQLKTRWQIGRTFFALGELALDRANTAAAHEFFSRALAAFQEMRAEPDVTRTRAALLTLV